MDRDELTRAEEFDLDEIKKLLDDDIEQDFLEIHEEPTQPDIITKEVKVSDEPVNEKPAEETAEKPAKSQKEPISKSFVSYLHDLAYLLIIVVVALSLCFRLVIVDGDSMFDTLVNGDYLLLINNVFYNDPKPGDIIVASKDSFRDGSPIVKRVIATEGQTVDIDFSTGTVYVDGVALEEDYIYSPTTNPEGVSFPLVVAEGCIFVMGDNRGRSLDSRSPEIGMIDKREVLGKAILVVLPGDDDGRVKRDYSRFGVIS